MPAHTDHNDASSVEKEDNLTSILERANRKLQEEIVSIDNLTRNQAILEQRLRLVDEALKKLSTQQLRLGIDHIKKDDLLHLLQAASIETDPNESEANLKDRVKKFLASL